MPPARRVQAPAEESTRDRSPSRAVATASSLRDMTQSVKRETFYAKKDCCRTCGGKRCLGRCRF